MINYLNSGIRNYGKKPIPVYKRQGWEFQAFISGNCLMVWGEGIKVPVKSPSLWVFHPGFAHGWTSEDYSETNVAVVHFSRVPRLVELSVESNGYTAVEITPENLQWMQEEIADLQQEVLKPRTLSSLKYRIFRDRLSLVLLSESLDSTEPVQMDSRDEQIVNAAAALFCAHMDEGFGIAELAEKTGYSTGHLRVLFHKIHGKSPKQFLQELRMERAAELLEKKSLTTLEIALECGFSSHSLFCRAFRNYYGHSPRVYAAVKSF